MVSIVIPTRNRVDDLKSCLDSLIPQLDEADELIIIDNCSTDNTKHVLSSFAKSTSQFKILVDCENNLAKLFNIGWRASSNQIISFLNDDTIPDKKWLSEVKKWFEILPGAHIIGGPTRDHIDRRIRQEQSKLGLFFRLYDIFVMEGKLFDIFVLTDYGAYSIGDNFPDHPIEVDSLTITNMSAKREILESLGGFDEAFQYANIDGEFFLRARRACKKIYAVPTAGVDHYPSPIGSTRSAFFLARDSAIFYSKMHPTTVKHKFLLRLNVASFFLFWFMRARVEGPGVLFNAMRGYREGLRVAKLANKKHSLRDIHRLKI